MRLDKFLKLIRIIKRRTIAQELCDAGNVMVNNDVKKPSYTVKKDDYIELKYFNHIIKFEVLEIPTQIVPKEEVEKYIKVKSSLSMNNDEKNIIDLQQHDSLFKLITSFQDEVHRFAITHHRKLRSKRNIKSALDEINGIGSVRKKKLLLKFGSISNIKKASIEELESILPTKVAKELIEKL